MATEVKGDRPFDDVADEIRAANTVMTRPRASPPLKPGKVCPHGVSLLR